MALLLSLAIIFLFTSSNNAQGPPSPGYYPSTKLSNIEQHPNDHDEIDIEFLGTTPGKPYTLQTNVYMKGSGDGGNIIGREVRFNLWFDPTQDFHHYAILWNPSEIIFFVDDVPIRHYPRKSDATFPERAMYVYGSIWDASSWATENGKYKADYRYQPFIGKYKDFKVSGCAANAYAACWPIPGSPTGSTGLSKQQIAAMGWVQENHKVYDYCQNPNRDRTQTPEC
nr:xyloglucan endotransglucosylase/hydrolase protein 31-like [Ipomoea batatas]